MSPIAHPIIRSRKSCLALRLRIMLARDLHEDNRQSWNSATKAHNSHKGNQADFLRSGGSTLFPEELDLLGDDVTGVDISDEAISFATKLSGASGIPATFVRADLFDWFERADERFDVV